MPGLLVIVVLGFLAWRYRSALGLDRLGKDAAPQIDKLRHQLGWRDGGAAGHGTRPASSMGDAARGAILGRIPPFDPSRLPIALVVGVVVALIAAALEMMGHTILSQLAGLAIGPFVGGIAVRSYWWVFVVAPGIAALIGAGAGITSVLVAIPVIAIAYGGVRVETLFAPTRKRRRRVP